ncbi:hypothetical protein EYF80_022801 [Liparis tanakae]|uniref:Uncharacterized protein n=1 Tax=Liparis tanakae TaxID=230148 RepID=A0A4Z2HMF1_9TELE|nr:hypothetical protein EYF80_022801 [Liparis tanakae]
MRSPAQGLRGGTDRESSETPLGETGIVAPVAVHPHRDPTYRTTRSCGSEVRWWGEGEETFMSVSQEAARDEDYRVGITGGQCRKSKRTAAEAQRTLLLPRSR